MQQSNAIPPSPALASNPTPPRSLFESLDCPAQVSWPVTFTSFTDSFSVVSFSYMASVPIDCVTQRTYYLSLFVQCALPACVIAAIAAGCMAVVLARPRLRRTLVNLGVKGAVFALFSVYPSLSSTIIQARRAVPCALWLSAAKAARCISLVALIPRPLPPSPPCPLSPSFPLQFFACKELGEGFSVMQYSHTTTCYTPYYNSLIGFAAAMVVVYPLLVPVAFFAILRSVSAAGRLRDPDMIARFGFLYEAYSPRFYWFEIVELFRKLFLSAAVILVLPGEVAIQGRSLRALERGGEGAFVGACWDPNLHPVPPTCT